MKFDLAASMNVLRRTPDVIAALIQGLPQELTHSDYGPNTWSAHQVVGHLIWSERTNWMPRLRCILENGENKSFESFDRKGHATLCRENSLESLLAIFRRERDENLRQLAALALTDAQIATRGSHPALGVVTVANLLATWPMHDLNHISQICKAMAFQQKEAVGPWERYLSVLAPPNPR